MDFNVQYENTKKTIEANLSSYIEGIRSSEQKHLYDSMAYSLEAGGKRFRPILFLQTIELLGGKPSEYLDVACSLEYIHTYSLIHDDLPAIDNDEYRRGKQTNHMVFGEDMAILAGDGLLNTALEILFNRLVNEPSKNMALGAQAIAKGAGISGMIGGQVVDIQSENTAISLETLKYIHEKKTGALIEASVLSAALMMGAKEEEIKALKSYAYYLGLAFQISDDILDCTGDFINLGKKTGSDEKNKKTTYVTFFGLEEAGKLLEESVNNAAQSLEVFDDKKSKFLVSLAYYVASRNR